MKKLIGYETGTWRLIGILTPDNPSQKTVIVSTTWNPLKKRGETALAFESSVLKSAPMISASAHDYDFEVIDTHNNEEEAFKAHLIRLQSDVYDEE